MSPRIGSADDARAVAEAARILRDGGIVAFPTETVYGLGANALSPEAVARIFEVKRRPSFDPLIVHVADVAAARRAVRSTDSRFDRLARAFWPGPLTLVLERHPDIPDLVTSGLSTVGVRVPAHPAALRLLSEAGVPVAAPSANPFGYVSPTTAAHVVDSLGDGVDFVLDGGPCQVGVESTIVSLETEPPTLLRPGGTPREAIEATLGGGLAERTPRGGSANAPDSPGQLESHYAPRTPLTLLPLGIAASVSSTNARVGALVFREAPVGPFCVVECLAPDGRDTTAAARLFAALRRLDTAGLDHIVAESCPETGLGRAIMDRLRRAATSGARG